MDPKSSRDIIAGVALSTFGVLFALYAATQLPLGAFSRMGSGMFPLLAGIAVASMGLTLLAMTLMRLHAQALPERGADVEAPEWQSLSLVLTAIASFGILISLFGAVPAVFALVLVLSLASNKLTLPVTSVLGVVLSLVAWLVFILGLGLPIQTVRWPL